MTNYLILVLVGVFGLVGVFFDAIPTAMSTAADALLSLLFLAGAIAWAVGMKGSSCRPDNLRALYANPLLNQGCKEPEPPLVPICGVTFSKTFEAGDSGSLSLWPDPLQGICQRANANEAFLFLGSVVSLVLTGLGYVMMKKKGKEPNVVV